MSRLENVTLPIQYLAGIIHKRLIIPFSSLLFVIL